jgi:uncharacterized protein YecT (DUF1311 family)
MRHLITLLISLLLPYLASAAECRDEPGNVDIECFEVQWDREIKNADKELNAVYKKLLKSIDDENTKADLIKAQRAWVTFYQLDCKARYDLSKRPVCGTLRRPGEWFIGAWAHRGANA